MSEDTKYIAEQGLEPLFAEVVAAVNALPGDPADPQAFVHSLLLQKMEERAARTQQLAWQQSFRFTFVATAGDAAVEIVLTRSPADGHCEVAVEAPAMAGVSLSLNSAQRSEFEVIVKSLATGDVLQPAGHAAFGEIVIDGGVHRFDVAPHVTKPNAGHLRAKKAANAMLGLVREYRQDASKQRMIPLVF
jgi:hypothetical protein